MFKVLVEMSSQIGDNYKKGAGHASTRGAEGSDFNRQLCCRRSELLRGQSKAALNMNKKAGGGCFEGRQRTGAELHRTARLHE